ncbi:MAG: hypothetical protein WC655_23620 [Candidatus Hydrogenedentales bacterium]|jgi:hypothetical protein
MTFRVRHKVDKCQPAIVKVLRDAGYAVQALEQGHGCPDLLVASPYTSEMWLLEVKMPDGVLTPAQVKWIRGWPAPVRVVHNGDEALNAVRGL